MPNRPIGVFDSGLGGLTALKQLQEFLPRENFIYFGDTARIPYGTRSLEVIKKYSLQDTRFLLSKDVKGVLVACGTVSSNALELLQETFALPIVGVVKAAAKRAVEIADKTGNKKVAVLGTYATIQSNTFTNTLLSLEPSLTVLPKACPMFVPLVENGHTSKDDIAANAIANQYLGEIAREKPSSVILGCTHYPLLSDIISSILPHSVLISSGSEAVFDLEKTLKDMDLLSANNNGKTKYYTSDDPIMFARSATTFLGKDISGEVAKIDIEDY